MYWSSLPNYLAALLVTPLVYWLTYWFLLVHCSSSNKFVKPYSRTVEKRKHFCVALQYVLPVQRNILESGQGHSGTKLESVLQCTATKILLMYSFSGNSAASAPISTFVSVSDLYVHISSSRTGRPIVGIYKSLTDAWMWKLGLRPRHSFSGNICSEYRCFVFAVWF